MDVKYKQEEWEQMRSGLRDLIGLGKRGKGAIDDLKALSKVMDNVASDISKYDRDGVISFTHRNQENKYDGLYDDYHLLERFSGKVGKIVNETIDEPFHKDIDQFVEKMRDASISRYTTQNRIGATDTITTRYRGYEYETVVEKKEIGLEDLFTGDTFYAEQMKLEYELWQGQVEDADITYEDYQIAAVNMNAFEYKSIQDTQLTKEFWVSITATVVIIGATILCPPAGLALGVAYGTLELRNAVSGTDLISGREIDTGERLLRGGLAPLDIIPGVSAVKRFSTMTRAVNVGSDLAQLGTRSTLTTRLTSATQQHMSTAQQQMRTIQDMVATAGKQAEARLHSAGRFLKEQGANAVVKVADDLNDVARLGDKGLTAMKNAIPQNGLVLDGMGTTARIPAENAHTLENATSGLTNWMRSSVGKVDGAGSGLGSGGKGTVNNRQIDFTRGFDVNPKYSSYEQRVKTTPVNKGEWSNKRAESLFISDKTGEIKKYLDEAGVDGVEYKNGMPDFSPFSKGEIKLENMTNDRKSNFSTADEELAKKWSTPEQKWTAEDIADWREDNKYTWHELNDLETIQLVPSKINSVFKHLGGVGEYNIKVKLGE